MIEALAEFLRGNPVALMFLVLGLGYLIGKISVRGFELGSVSGVLFVGLFFGKFGFATNATVQSIGFVLFIFSVGLQAGPSFFSVIRQDGLKYLTLACRRMDVLVCGRAGVGASEKHVSTRQVAGGGSTARL